jgi:hypothetical protein
MYFGTTHKNSNILLRICIRIFQGYIGVVPLFWVEAVPVLAIGSYSDVAPHPRIFGAQLRYAAWVMWLDHIADGGGGGGDFGLGLQIGRGNLDIEHNQIRWLITLIINVIKA